MTRVASSLMADGQPSWRTAGGLLRGAFDARLRGAGAPPDPTVWSYRTRAAILFAALPCCAGVALALIFYGSLGTRITRGGGQLPGKIVPASGLSQAGHLVQYSQLLLCLALAIAIVAMSYGWLRLLGAIRRSGSPGRRRTADFHRAAGPGHTDRAGTEHHRWISFRDRRDPSCGHLIRWGVAPHPTRSVSTPHPPASRRHSPSSRGWSSFWWWRRGWLDRYWSSGRTGTVSCPPTSSRAEPGSPRPSRSA